MIEVAPVPDDIATFIDLLKYAWVGGLYWVKGFTDRLKKVEEKQAISPTNEQVEDRVDKELLRVNTKLDRMEALLINLLTRKTERQKPQTVHIDQLLGD